VSRLVKTAPGAALAPRSATRLQKVAAVCARGRSRFRRRAHSRQISFSRATREGVGAHGWPWAQTSATGSHFGGRRLPEPGPHLARRSGPRTQPQPGPGPRASLERSVDRARPRCARPPGMTSTGGRWHKAARPACSGRGTPRRGQAPLPGRPRGPRTRLRSSTAGWSPPRPSAALLRAQSPDADPVGVSWGLREDSGSDTHSQVGDCSRRDTVESTQDTS
jgi:hypothetical protein